MAQSGVLGVPRVQLIRGLVRTIDNSRPLRRWSADIATGFIHGGSNVPVENSYLSTQILIRLREMSCGFASPCRVSPPKNSWISCRLNSMLWDRCFDMGTPSFRCPAPRSIQFNTADLSGPGGPIHSGRFCTPNYIPSPEG